MSAVGSGFELISPSASVAAWVTHYGPALRVGMSLLTLAARAGGLPIPNLVDVMGEAMATVAQQADFLITLSSGIAQEVRI